MKLNYRGVGYEANTAGAGPVNSNPTTTDLNYRGVPYHTNLPSEGSASERQTPAETRLESASAALKYRGVAYTPSAEPAPEAATELVYRGVAYTPDQAVAQTPAANLQYRGTAYTTAAPVATPAVEAPTVAAPAPQPEVAIAQPTLSTNDRARALMVNHHRMVKQRQQVMLLRLAESVGLPVDNVAPYWNHIQGKVHPSFWATYDRGHASAS